MEDKIRQYLDGNLSQQEQLALLTWLRDDENRLFFESLKSDWWKARIGENGSEIVDFNRKRLLDRLEEKEQLARTQRFLNLYKYAAFFILFLAITSVSVVYFYQHSSSIDLKYTEVQTEYGQMSNMTLPDGSKVWLNSGTKLKYSSQFGIENRDLEIEGEAYFSVEKNTEMPFVVDMGKIKVEVTGTQFSINNYSEEKSLYVVLEKGSVNIKSAQEEFITKLVPNEMAILEKSSMVMDKKKVKPYDYTAWRAGILNIYELPLEELVLKLEKRYNQKFEVDPEVREFPYTFRIEGESLSDVLHLIERISPVKAFQDQNKIRLKYMKH